MANSLTGDFDLVAEFSVLAVNRVLAAMHRVERFPHSMSVRVNDHPDPHSTVFDPTLVGSVDVYGEPTVDPRHIGIHVPIGVLSDGTTAAPSHFDNVVNLDAGIFELPPIVPSNLQGKAQLQVFPPTIEVTQGSGENVTVRLELMSRYFPDPQTSPLAEFVRGDLRITVPLHQVPSPIGNVIDIDLKAAIINFTPSWSSHPLSAEDLAGVSLLVRNALKTSFLPSSERPKLPPDVKHVQLKTFSGGQGAVAALLNLGDAAGNPASASNVFLGGADEFAFAAGVDFVRAAFQPTIDNILNTPIPRIPIPYINISYGIRRMDEHDHRSQVEVDLQLENGRIVLIITGYATTPHWWAPDFGFTVKQPLTLNPNGATADLVIGEMTMTTTSIIADQFTDGIKAGMEQMRDQALADSDAFTVVNDKLSADKNLSEPLNSLLVPPNPPPGFQPETFSLAYTSIDIRPPGIIMHGSLSAPAWPGAHVEFSKIPSSPGAGIGGLPGNILQPTPDYTALKSWIPGGTIDRYEWSTLGQSQPLLVDSHRFVHVDPPPEFADGSPSSTPVSAFRPLCLKVVGSRLTSSGPVVAEPVSASMCGFTLYQIVDVVAAGIAGSAPMVALAHPGAGGRVEVTGHAASRVNGTGRGAPNLLVHFADDKSAGQLELLTQALRESGREDATTAVLAVLSSDQLAKARYVPGVTYAEDPDGSWARALGVKVEKLPLTLIAGRKREIVWRQEGEIDSGALAGALRKVLVKGGSVRVGMLSSSARIGRLPPNFLFEYAPGHDLTVRKLSGQPVRLVFWKSSSRPSIEAVKDLQTRSARKNGQQPVVLAINDGEERELAKRFAAENGLSATIVADPNRQIAAAYGVNMWPTIISLDATGMVSSVRYGRDSDVSESTTVEQAQRRRP